MARNEPFITNTLPECVLVRNLWELLEFQMDTGGDTLFTGSV